MARKMQFGIDEWYHCYNRGVDKRVTFEEEADYIRFVELLYLVNDTAPLSRKDIGTHSAEEIFTRERKETLVAIGAYALMPNHYHLLIKEIRDGGLSTFMQKLGTAYTMYFNQKYRRVGSLFVGPFRVQHVENDRYFQYIIHYIHLNPAELFETGWKKGKVKNAATLIAKLTSYPYSSLLEHNKFHRPANSIIDSQVFTIAQPLTIAEVIQEAKLYYEESSEFEH